MSALGRRTPSDAPLVQQRMREGVIYYTIADRTMTLAEWCAELGQDFREVDWRLRDGWPAFEALNKPTPRRA